MRSVKLFISLSFLISLYSPAQNLNWVKGFGPPSYAAITGVDVDTQGSVFTSGFFNNTVDFDPGAPVYTLTGAVGKSIFISKLDAAGNFQWAASLETGGLPDREYVNHVVTSSGEVIVAGYFIDTVDFDPGPGVYTLTAGSSVNEKDGFIWKLDAQGNLIWAKQFIGQFSYIMGITLDNAGNICTTGYFSGPVDFDPGPSAFTFSAGTGGSFICKLDSNGDFIWAKRIENAIGDEGYAITADQFNDLYITGYCLPCSPDMDPGPSVYTLSFGSELSTYILKLNSNGDFVWAKGFMGSSQSKSSAFSIKTDASGNVYSCGMHRGVTDFDPGPAIYNLTSPNALKNIFITKLDALGNFIWAQNIGDSGSDEAYNIDFSSSGNVYISGYFNNTVDFDSGPGVSTFTCADINNDLFLLKLSPSGNFLDAKQIGGINDQTCFAMKIDAQGLIYMGGAFSGTVDFDPGPATTTLSSSYRDAFILKLADSNVGLGELNTLTEQIEFYPNPAKDKLFIEFGDAAIIERIKICDELGREVLNFSEVKTRAELNLLDLQNGIYFVTISNENGEQKIKKLIIAAF